MAKSEKTIAELLATLLADTYLLYVKTQNFHWNVTDPRFYSLHKLFEEQYEELAEAVDTIAERIRALGSKSPGSMKQFLILTRLSEASGNHTGQEMIKELLKGHETLIKELKKDSDIADKLGDAGSSDLCIQRLRSHEKTAWMLRSHL